MIRIDLLKGFFVGLSVGSTITVIIIISMLVNTKTIESEVVLVPAIEYSIDSKTGVKDSIFIYRGER